MTSPREERRQRLGPPDAFLMVLVGALILIGLQVVFSATFALSLSEHNHVFYYLMRQGLWAVVGSLLLLLCMRVDYHLWITLSPALIALALVLLTLVLIPDFNVEANGATRWLRLGPLPPIQPSEFVKLAAIIALAAWLAGPEERVRSFALGLIPFVAFMGILSVLILRQPDLGTTLVLLLVATTMFFLAGADLKLMATLTVGGTATVLALALGASYRMARWQSFLDPWQDPSGVGFHIIQLLIALGSGGIFGLGLGESRQKFFYIPGAHTDGVFAIIGEEMGFMGCLAVLLLFAALLYRGIRIAQRAPDAQGALLVCGILCWFGYQALINIAGITRSLPMTGIPLPFLSYGGSSLAAAMAAVGILLNVSRQMSDQPVEQPVSVGSAPAAGVKR